MEELRAKIEDLLKKVNLELGENSKITDIKLEVSVKTNRGSEIDYLVDSGSC